MRSLTLGIVALAALSACDERELILPGARADLEQVYIDPARAEAAALRAGEVPENASVPISLPGQSANADWTHAIGTPRYRPSHPALRVAPAQIFAVGIGAGNSRRQAISASPVVDGSRIFTLDAAATVTATSTAGARLWQVDLTPAGDRSSDASGGGLAYADGRVYVSSAFGRLVALDAASGGVAWTQDLGAAATGAPTVFGDTVYVVAGDAVAWAIDTANGKVRWQRGGAPDNSNIFGGPAPAVTDRLVVFASGTGDVTGTLREGGIPVWNVSVSGRRLGVAVATVSDITGAPVIDGSTVYAGNNSGRIAAIDTETGQTKWSGREGVKGPVWPVGGALFFVSDRNELVRMNASDGSRVWGVDLPLFVKNRPRRQAEIFVHYGPILAGGQIVLASSDGFLRFFDPASGTLTAEVPLPSGAASAPVVAGGTLYVVNQRGQLVAFR